MERGHIIALSIAVLLLQQLAYAQLPTCTSGSCTGFQAGTSIRKCNYAGLTYFQDYCDVACNIQDRAVNQCWKPNALAPGDGCTAAAECNALQPDTCIASAKCNPDCTYAPCDNGCCDSLKKSAGFHEGYCTPECTGNNLPSADSFGGGGSFTPKKQTLLNATLRDDDDINESVTIGFYRDSGCTLLLASGTCTPLGSGNCKASAALTLGPQPEEYGVYYNATDGRFTTQCAATDMSITTHNFTISWELEYKPMVANITSWLYINPISQPEGTLMDGSKIANNSYTISKGAAAEGPKSFAWDPAARAWVSNFTPAEFGAYQLSANFTDNYGLTNFFNAQLDVNNTLYVSLDAPMPIVVPAGSSAVLYMDITNAGNKQRTYNVSLNGDLYQVSFNGESLSGKKWRTSITIPKQSSTRAVITIFGREVTQGPNEFKIGVRNTATNSESATVPVAYQVTYGSEGRKFAPDVDLTSTLLLAAAGLLYTRKSFPCRQKN